MSKLSKVYLQILLLCLPGVAYAQSDITSLITNITTLIQSAVPVLLMLAVLVCFWGLVKFIYHADDEKARESGRGIMVWGMIALFVMVALWAIVGFIQSTLDIGGTGPTGAAPNTPTTIPTR
jgi:fumarate reductase subunit D